MALKFVTLQTGEKVLVDEQTISIGGVPTVVELPVSEIVAADGSIVAPATEAKLEAVRALLAAPPGISGSVAVSNLPATQAVSLAAAVDVSDRAARLVGHVTVDAAPAVTGAVSVTNLPATQAVSAAALPLPAGASTEATLALIKSKTDNIDVALSTRAVTGLTDAQMRAAAVPVSGPATDAQLRATALPVSISGGATEAKQDTLQTRANLLASEATIAKRFGVALGTPPGAVSAAGPTTLYTPAAGKGVRLKWMHLATPQTNSVDVVATVRIGSTVVYIVPLSNPGVFSHASVREGAADAALTIALSPAGQTVYPNFDVEDFP